MKLRGFKTLLIAGLLIGASSSPVFAQDQDSAMSFGVDEAKAAPIGPSPVAGLLAEGKKLYGAKNYLQAAQKFYAVTQSTSPAAQIDKNDAQYQLAKTLFRLKLYQSSLSYYRVITDIGETHPFFLPAINGLVELTDVIPEDSQLTERLVAYANNYPNDIPKRYRNRFAYLVGRYFDRNADQDRAIKMLQDVESTSPDYAKAQYIAGVAHVEIDQPKEGLQNFKNSLRWLTDKRKKGELTNDEKRLLELGYLALARVFYSTAQYKQSIKFYSKIDRRSENWPVALFESSWAYFALNDYNKALGNLQSVTSPFFSDRYFPEAPILSAYLYFYNCRYDRVRGILDDFSYDYEPLLDTLRKMIVQFKGGTTYDESGKPVTLPSNLEGAFDWLVNARTSEIQNKQLERVVSAALNDKEIRGKLNYVVNMDKELATLAELPEDFQNSPFGRYLKQSITDDLVNTKINIGDLVVQRLKDVSTTIENLIVNSKQILFEVERAEREGIDADLRADTKVATAELKADKIKTTSEELVWTFDGEYWRDELGYYVVSIVSQCKR